MVSEQIESINEANRGKGHFCHAAEKGFFVNEESLFRLPSELQFVHKVFHVGSAVDLIFVFLQPLPHLLRQIPERFLHQRQHSIGRGVRQIDGQSAPKIRKQKITPIQTTGVKLPLPLVWPCEGDLILFFSEKMTINCSLRKICREWLPLPDLRPPC